MPTNETHDNLQRTLQHRQTLADAAASAVAHGQRRADSLYARLAERQHQLERDHPHLVQRLLPEWAIRDADQLGAHMRDETPDCGHCQAVRGGPRPTTPTTSTNGPFTVPLVCGATNLGEALRRIAEGAAMIRCLGRGRHR